MEITAYEKVLSSIPKELDEIWTSVHKGVLFCVFKCWF